MSTRKLPPMVFPGNGELGLYLLKSGICSTFPSTLGERWFIEITFLYRTWYCGKRGFIFLFIFQLIPLSLNHKKLKRREKRENLSEGEKYSKGKGREGLQIDLNLWQFIEQWSTTETNHSFQCPHGYLSFWVIFRKSID